MTKRALKAIPEEYAKQNPAIAALVEFAAQNSGIESHNYYDPYDLQAGRKSVYYHGLRAYRQEVRSIGGDWKRFKEALQVAIVEGVTDADVIAEAPHAFSGRLTPMAHCRLWGQTSDHYPVIQKQTAKEAGFEQHDREPAYTLRTAKDALKHMLQSQLTFGWDYCAGQYFPTEYRKAAATLLEYATRRARQAKPPQKRAVQSIAELKRLNESNGMCWFEKGSMKFFGTRIESGIIKGKYFITSEQPPHGPRKFSVRSFDDTGNVDTVGEFCDYDSKREAIEAIPELDQRMGQTMLEGKEIE